MGKKIGTPNREKNVFDLKLPAKGEYALINKLIMDAPQGSIIRLTKGNYVINETITLDKSIRLVGEGIDKTELEGRDLPLLISSNREQIIELEGISFLQKGKTLSIVVKITASELKYKKLCFFWRSRERRRQVWCGLVCGGRYKIGSQQQ